MPANTTGLEIDARTWSFDIFGEDWVASVIGHPLMTWDASAGVGTRATQITDSSTGDSERQTHQGALSYPHQIDI